MIRDVLAAVLMLGGAGIMLLGSLGLVRFPDVFTRMHASAKAAAVGVIAVTGAAALEAGTVGGVLTLLLVVALLFLSAPQGMSLLARAAYHDAETPRTPQTREVHSGLPITETIGPPLGGGTSAALAGWLAVVWIALFGSFGAGVVVGGLLVAGVIAFGFRALAPRWPEVLLHPVHAARFLGFFTVQLVAATWDVIVKVLRDPDRLRPAVVEVPLRATTRNEVTLLMTAISFTPGTVALEGHDGRLYVHVLDAEDPADVVAAIGTLEAYIIAAFGGRRPRLIADGGDSRIT